MIALALDPSAAPVAVAGRGLGALRRFTALQAARGIVRLFSDRPVGLEQAGDALLRRLPSANDLAGLRALWITGLPDETAADFAALARSERVLVNVEDRPALCDFHSVAEVRRGDLLLTVSTSGASPRLAARIRARLEAEYPHVWCDRLAALGTSRRRWREQGEDVAAMTDALLEANGWLV